MFSIYGISGQIFSGTLEQMNRVHALARARSARTIAEDGDELGAEAFLPADHVRTRSMRIAPCYRATSNADR